MNEQNEKKFTIKELLQLRGLNTSKKIKLVRHQDNRKDDKTNNRFDVIEMYKNKKDWFELYQSVQGETRFDDCDYIIACIGDGGTKAKFVGVYSVKHKAIKYDKDKLIQKFGINVFNDFMKEYPTFMTGNYIYDLVEMSEFNDFKDRIIIEWGKSTINWHQWQDKEIIEILPSGKLRREFTDFLDFYLEFDELQDIIRNSDSNKIWHTMLSSVFGVYLILDKKTGRQYVGSASGQDGGILGRWEDYVKTGHGGNNELVELLHKEGLGYCQNFRFSILQTISKSRTKSEVNAVENLYKEKLGTREHGYNSN